MLAEYLQHVRQQCDSGTEEDESDNIEGMCLLFAVVGQMDVDEDQTCQSNGNIEEENEAPVKITDDEAPGDGSEHGSHQGGYGNKAHHAQEIRLGKCSHQSKPAYRDHHRPAATLQDATRDQ